MKSNKEIHPVQGKALIKLLFKTPSRFSELNVDHLDNDHFTFHLNQLLSLEFIEKINDKYQLTVKGKEFASLLDPEAIVTQRQGKPAVLVVCIDSSNLTKYLIQKRLKLPYYDYYSFIAGKIRWGESVLEAAKRQLKEETGLNGDMSLVGIHHKTDISNDKSIIEDKFYFIVKAENTEGTLQATSADGIHSWLTAPEIKKLDKKLTILDEALEFIEGSKKHFSEIKLSQTNY